MTILFILAAGAVALLLWHNRSPAAAPQPQPERSEPSEQPPAVPIRSPLEKALDARYKNWRIREVTVLTNEGIHRFLVKENGILSEQKVTVNKPEPSSEPEPVEKPQKGFDPFIWYEDHQEMLGDLAPKGSDHFVILPKYLPEGKAEQNSIMEFLVNCAGYKCVERTDDGGIRVYLYPSET